MPTRVRCARRAAPWSSARSVWSNRMAPRVTRAARERQRRSVVLPAPDLPMTATNCPGSIVTDRSSRAGAAFPGKILATLSSITAGDRSATMSGPTVARPHCDFVTEARRFCGELQAEPSQLLFEILDPAFQVFDHDLERGRLTMTVAHDRPQATQSRPGLHDPFAQALVVRRTGDRDLEAAVDGAPLFELPSSAEHAVVCGSRYAGLTSTLCSVLPVRSLSETVSTSLAPSIFASPKYCMPSVGGRFCFIPGGAEEYFTSGPNVRSMSPGPKVPALIGPATNSQNGVKSVNCARAGS